MKHSNSNTTEKANSDNKQLNAQLTIINSPNGEQLVDARLLHRNLQVQTMFSHWIKRRIAEYGFSENEDYFLLAKFGKRSFSETKGGGHNRVEYHLTLDMAKELAMLEKNEIGRSIRRYFIAKEKEAAQLMVEASTPTPHQIGNERQYREGEIFVTTLGNLTTHAYYHQGELYTKLSLLTYFLGYTNSGLPKPQRERVGSSIVSASIGNVAHNFINYSGFEILIGLAKKRISGEVLEQVQIHFGMKAIAEKTFEFTTAQMIAIISQVNRRPVNKAQVIDMLLGGKGGVL